MKKRMAIAIIILLVVFGGSFVWSTVRSYFMKQFFANFEPPAATVSATKAVAQTWSTSLTSVGVLKASNGVDVSPDVNGQVVNIHFKSGQKIEKGESLLQLDDSTEKEQLNKELAQLELDRANYERQLTLFKSGVIAKFALDEAKAKLSQAEAAVTSCKVMIAKKDIKAPFTGKLGIRQVDIGQYLTAGMPIVSLQALQPIFVDFSLPERYVGKLTVGQEVKVKVDAFEGQIFPGKVSAIDSKVDSSTHSIKVQADLPNENELLYPGIFANVEIVLPTVEKVIAIPQIAIDYTLYGNMVYVVEEEGKNKDGNPKLVAKQRLVTVGTHRGELVSITKGIKVGEEVITTGQVKLRPNSVVTINNSITFKDHK